MVPQDLNPGWRLLFLELRGLGASGKTARTGETVRGVRALCPDGPPLTVGPL